MSVEQIFSLFSITDLKNETAKRESLKKQFLNNKAMGN